jgi:putative Holliday junction resolvase
VSFGPGDTLPTTGRLLAVDPGSVRLGLALSDPGQVLASPGDVLPVVDENDVHTIAEQVAEVAVDREAVGIVVGWPRDMRGRETAPATRSRQLADAVREATGLPVALWDERLTTVEAERVMIQQDASRKERRAQIDRVAAAIILRGVLDAQRHRR